MHNRVDAPLRRPLTKKLSYKKRVCYPVAVYVKFQLSISESSRDMMGSQIYNRGAVPLRRLFAKKITSEKSTLPYRCVYNINFLSLVVPEI